MRQKTWPSLTYGRELRSPQCGDHQEATEPPPTPKSHTLSSHRFLGSLSIPNLDSHFPRGWRLSSNMACPMAEHSLKNLKNLFIPRTQPPLGDC